jgi:HAD superfamily hydrolase (TIGR01509 family)
MRDDTAANTRQEIKAVLFDLDGTLATSIGSLRSCYERFLRSFSAQPTQEEFEELIGPSLLTVTEILQSRHSLPGNLMQLYGTYLDLVNESYAREVVPQEGAESLLQWLQEKNLSTALVTSAPRLLVDSFLSRYGWNGYFNAVVTADDVSLCKPSAEPYVRALQLLQLPAPHAVAVEDSPRGVMSACAAGLRVIGITIDQQRSLEQSGASHLVGRLEEVRSCLGRFSMG